MQFLLQNAFQTPMFMIRPEILRRIQPTGIVERVRTAQNSVMNNLLQTARLDRMVEQAAIDGPTAYTPMQFLTELRNGVWSELAKPGDADRHLPPQPAALVSRHDRRSAERQHRAERRGARAAPRRAARARRGDPERAGGTTTR